TQVVRIVPTASAPSPLNFYFNVIGTSTNANATITGLQSTANIKVGMVVSGTNIPAGATVIAVGATTVTLSANATAAGSTGAWIFSPVATVTGAAGGPLTVTFSGGLSSRDAQQIVGSSANKLIATSTQGKGPSANDVVTHLRSIAALSATNANTSLVTGSVTVTGSAPYYTITYGATLGARPLGAAGLLTGATAGTG